MATQFLLSLQVRKHHRILETVAYDLIPLSAGLSLFLSRRQSQRTSPTVPQLDAHYAPGGPVARRGVDLRNLGRLARGVFSHRSCLASSSPAIWTDAQSLVDSRTVARADLPGCRCRLGVFSRQQCRHGAQHTASHGRESRLSLCGIDNSTLWQ